MTSVYLCPALLGFPVEVVAAEAIKANLHGEQGGMFMFQRLAADPIGSAVVTFSGVVAGSEIRVYDPSLNELAGIESCAADQVLTWSAYSPGSPGNDVQIKIINTAYKIKDFPFTSTVGNVTIPVQMEVDPWFSNP